jgi:signal peptidase I
MAREAVETRRLDYAYEDEQGEQRGARLLREILEVAILTLLLFIVVHLVVQNYRVDGPSMQTTLHNHEYILVDKAQYVFGKPHRGDVIVFEYPLDTTQDYVKRVIGVPGDTVKIDATNGTVEVDGTVITEPYISSPTYLCSDGSFGGETNTWVLTSDEYFVMGDNRSNSSDSRCWGPVPARDIIGKAALVYWPLGDLHLLQDWSGVFSNIHQ